MVSINRGSYVSSCFIKKLEKSDKMRGFATNLINSIIQEQEC